MTDRSPEAMTPRQRTMALLTLVVALIVELVDMTIVNTALPAIKADFRADAEAAQWIVAGYSLAFALLLMAGGRLGDSFGYRRMFVIGVAGFTLSSMACGLAGNATQLVIARLLQGATGAVMAPQFMALLQVMYSPLERVAKMALFGVLGGIAAIAGPIVGGLLIEADLLGLGWRTIFLINLPIGALAAIWGWLYLPETRSARAKGIDSLGIVLFALALGALLWPLIRVTEGGFGLAEWLALAACLPLFAIAWRHVAAREAAGRPALFDPALLAIETFRKGTLISLVFSAANAGFLLVFAFALQAERGQTPLVTGFLHMPFGLGTMAGMAVFARKLLPRVGKAIMVAGALVMAGSVVLTLAGIGTLGWSWAVLTPVLIVCGAGMGAIVGCIGPVAVARVGRDHAGAASALLKTSQQLGSAIGIALVGSLYFGWGTGKALAPSLAALFVLVPLLLLSAWWSSRLPGDIFDQNAPRGH